MKAPGTSVQRTPEASEQPPRVVLFDGVCNLCNGFVQFIIKRDPKARFRFGALQSEEARDMLQGTDVRPEDLSTVIYVRNGRVLTRSSAALHVLKDLGGAWAIAYGFIIVPPFIRDAVYHWVARNRYKWFGQRESCMIPTPELRSRFLNGLKG